MSAEAIIYAAAEADPAQDQFSRENGGTTTTFVPVPNPAAAVEAAKALAARGITRIEICGGLGPSTAASVMAEVPVPVGVCVFGVESVTAAAAFDERLRSGQNVVVAVLFLEPGADPVADRYTTDSGTVRMLFIPVPDQSAVADTATGAVTHDGAHLVELYRGIDLTATAETIKAVADRVPVGAVYYGRAA